MLNLMTALLMKRNLKKKKKSKMKTHRHKMIWNTMKMDDQKVWLNFSISSSRT